MIDRRLSHPTNARREAILRTLLSALAGSGLTAGGFAGPLASAALAKGAPAGTTVSVEGSSPPVSGPGETGAAYWNRIHLNFSPVPVTGASPTHGAIAAHPARGGPGAPSPLVVTGALSAAQWNQLIGRVDSLLTPTVATKASPAALPDPRLP